MFVIKIQFLFIYLDEEFPAENKKMVERLSRGGQSQYIYYRGRKRHVRVSVPKECV